MFVHVTVMPTVTVSTCGSNPPSVIETMAGEISERPLERDVSVGLALLAIGVRIKGSHASNSRITHRTKVNSTGVLGDIYTPGYFTTITIQKNRSEIAQSRHTVSLSSVIDGMGMATLISIEEN